jgi:transposase-like protein
MSRKYIRYDKVFKDKIIQECIESNDYNAVAKKYELPSRTIYDWFNNYKNKSINENKRRDKDLIKKVEDLALENDILKELLKKTNPLWLKE